MLSDLTLWYAPLFSALAVAVLASHLLSVVTRDRPCEAQEWEFEKRRQMRMRNDSICFRWFEPFIDEIATLLRTPPGTRALDALRLRQSVTEALDRLGTACPFHCSDYIALALFQAILIGLFSAICLVRSTSTGYLMLVVPSLMGLMFYSRINQLKSRATRRLELFNKRLPFSIDLMALMMDAGATFMESLFTMVAENEDNPVGQEFGELHRKVLSGQTMHHALENLQSRMRDPTVDEIVFSIINSEKLGTPKSKTLLRLANQMRLKRSQDVEKAIGQAKTMMTFPGFVIMLACLLIVAAPFGLAALQQKPW